MQYADHEPYNDFEPPTVGPLLDSSRYVIFCDIFATGIFLRFMPYFDPFLHTKFRLGFELLGFSEVRRKKRSVKPCNSVPNEIWWSKYGMKRRNRPAANCLHKLTISH